MTGANRPPWVDLQDFYRLPFNYCDRWCEKCQLTSECRVFKDEQKRKKKYSKQGKDPNSMEYALETMKDVFKEVREGLAKSAKKFGIDIESIDYSLEEEDPPPETFEIYQLALKFTKAGKRILSDLQVVTEDVDEDLLIRNTETISYYNLVIPPKVYRALLSRTEEGKDPKMIESCPDARNSGFLLLNWLEEIIHSLSEIISHPPLRPMREKLIKFKKSAINLKEVINIEFDVEEEKLVN